jgi:hypothetical protein
MLIIGYNFSAIVMFLLARVCCVKKIDLKMKDSKYYNFVKFESARAPVISGLLIRQIGVPYLIKNSLVAVGGTPFYIYMLTLQPKVWYSTALSVFYSITIRNFSELFGSHKHRGETLEDKQKRKMIDKIRYTMFFVSIMIMVIIVCYMKRRIKEFNKFLERV